VRVLWLAAAFGAPGWVAPTFTFLLVLGVPVVLVVAWAFEITPEGLKRTEQVPREESITHVTGNRLNYLVTGLLVLAVAFMAVDNYLLDDRPSESHAAAPPAESAAHPPPAAQTSESAALPNSLAVIPFNNMSPNESARSATRWSARRFELSSSSLGSPRLRRSSLSTGISAANGPRLRGCSEAHSKNRML
jgi:hypothetical protein